MEIYDSLVIGAGQAGLSSSYHLTKRGIAHVVLDANPIAGGAWQHRWDALTMHDVHRVADLPGEPIPEAADDERANTFVPAYFTAYEGQMRLPVIRPVDVTSVSDEDGLLRVDAGDRRWLSR
ncbi:MAG: NAD(P)-binding protein, partial [Aeromicrobium sp.]